MILNGSLLPGQKLPSTRELALELGVSRITIKSVYEQLISEGYVQEKQELVHLFLRDWTVRHRLFLP